MKQLIETVEGLEKRGIGFRSLTETLDTTTPGGKLVFHPFAGLAEFERGLIRKRPRAGLDAARACGRKGGRPPQLKVDHLKAARAMLAEPEINVEEVARRLVGHALSPHTRATRNLRQPDRCDPGSG